MNSGPADVRLQDETHLAHHADEIDSAGIRVPSVVDFDSDSMRCGDSCGGGGGYARPKGKNKRGGAPIGRMIRISKALSPILRTERDREMQKRGFTPLRSVFPHTRLRPEGAASGDILSIVAGDGGRSQKIRVSHDALPVRGNVTSISPGATSTASHRVVSTGIKSGERPNVRSFDGSEKEYATRRDCRFKGAAEAISAANAEALRRCENGFSRII